MNLAYPIQAILMYLSMLFAPPEVDRITIELPGNEARIELVRNGGKWESGGNVFAAEKDSLVTFGPNGRETLKITDFIALPGEHDWSKNPKLALGGGITLEKVATGFTVHRKVSSGEGNGVYQIRYHKPAAEGERISVNVFGEVVNPGVHAVLADGTLEDTVAAAGGPSAAADMKRISIIRGPAGSVPEVTTVDMTIVKGASPRIQAGDTVHVPASNEVGQKLEEKAKLRFFAEQWLAKTDAGEYDASWQAAAAFFQKSITAEVWSEAMKKFREPLGGIKSRNFRDLQKADALPGAPDGKYVIIQFDTSFAAKAKAVETVTFMLEEDASWKPAGYVIR